jgi:hypothetical protein
VTQDPNENEALREETLYLHFAPDDPRGKDMYFDSLDEAIDFANYCELSFVTEDWEPSGLFEERIECKTRAGIVVGQLVRCTVKFWNL